LVPMSRAQVVKITRGALLIPKQILSLPNASVRAMVRPQVRPALKQAVTAGEAAARALSSGAPLNVPASQGTQLPATSSGLVGAQVVVVPPPPNAPAVVLYDQYNNGSANATLSATFTDFPTFSSDLADDFVVPAGQTWNVSSVDADGVYFNGSGPATSWNVFIYSNSGTLPGAMVFSTLNQPVTQVGSTFTVNLSPAAVLPPGTYWVETQANMTFGTQGEWGWTDRTVQSNNTAAWQNPGGGFGLPACITWNRKLTCVPTAGGPDQVFRLNGTIGTAGTPTPTPTPGTPTPTPTPNPCQYHVLIAYSDTNQPTDLRNQVLAEPGVVAADLFDAQVGTPTLAQLQQYQIVVPYSNFPFQNDVTLGNNLADYVDGGGIVVQYGFSHYGPGQPYGVNGRWVTGNYNPYNYSTNLEFGAYTLGAFNAGHPLMAGVTTLNSNFGNIVAPAGGATQVAATSNGNSLVAFRPVSGGHTTVGVTGYVGSDATESGHWGRVIVNAGRWLITCQTPTPTPTNTPTNTPIPPTNTPTPTPPPGSLTDLSPAKMWVGLKNSDDVGLRLDLLAEVFINATQVGQGELDNVASGSSGFNNAILQTIPLSCTGCPVPAPPGSQLKIRVSARRTCFGGGHTSGSPALWYNGQPIDAGLTRDAGSRFDATIGGSTDDYFLRLAFALEKTPGNARTSIGILVNSLAACPARPFTSWGTWVRTLP
jgi:hypothetical protein